MSNVILLLEIISDLAELYTARLKIMKLIDDLYR